MTSSDVIAVVAVAISLVSAVSAVLTYQRSIVAERRGRMPALVFRRNDTEHSQLLVANVGVGPAMNIVYAQGGDPAAGEPIALNKGFRETWFNPIHLRPIEPDGEVAVPWEIQGAGLGLKYTDAFGKPYVVKAGPHGMLIFEGDAHLPGWRLSDVPYLWQLERLGLTPEGTRWGECKPGQGPTPIQLPQTSA